MAGCSLSPLLDFQELENMRQLHGLSLMIYLESTVMTFGACGLPLA